MVKKIGITGASSVVGQELIYLLSSKFAITGFSQNSKDFIRYSFDEDVDENNFSGLDFLILCAWDKKNNQKSFKATEDLLRVCLKFKIIPIFISTFSVFKSSKSKYGYYKYEAEKKIIDSQGYVLRCGLIKTQEYGGVLGKLHTFMSLSPVCIHLKPDPIVYLTEVKHIVYFIELVLSRKTDQRVYNIAKVNPVKFSEVMHFMKSKRFHLKVSTTIILFVIKQQRSFFNNFGLGTDNLNGLICEIDKIWEGFEITEGS
jgi:dTDP-4-dehydrorhamnose reductase